jgi:2-polyprenyl-3-methyl-5-hydroxy-6-metoxy-1,4-benzoquinol methylase
MLTKTGATGVQAITAPRQHAYTYIEQIEEQVGRPGKPIILCLGATATVLADRLARKGEHALDLGHIGMFMRHAGSFSVTNLLSKAYRRMLLHYHSKNKWGTGGWKNAGEVIAFRDEIGAQSILDYGCGEGTLKRALSPIRVAEYDPGIMGKDGLPKPAELVVCGDVLEHVELEHLDTVLQHLMTLAGKGIFLTIAMFPADKKLPDGRDLHLILKDEKWWLQRLLDNQYIDVRHETRGKTLYVWFKK